jgi:hypothetical protein
MVTIGDSFAVVAILGGICLSAWAMILSVALIFPGKANHARSRLVNKPWASFFTGFGIWATVGFVSVALIGNPFPLAKLMGWMVFMTLAAIAAVGSAGLANLASERLRTLAPDMTPYAATAKSAAVIVVAGLVPVLGWFLIIPFLTFAATGAGIQALMLREPVTAESPRFMP